jgi:hypothetical protein
MALALSRATPAQDIPKAIEHVKQAIAGGPSEVRSWHLLGLLLMASGEWSKSMKIIEEGIKVSEQVFSRSADGEGEKPTVTLTYNTQARDYGLMSRVMQEYPSEALLDPSSDALPPARLLIVPTPDPPLPSRREEFEVALQLRLTLLALVEHAQGPEKAAGSWLELFSWFRDRKGWVLKESSGGLQNFQPGHYLPAFLKAFLKRLIQEVKPNKALHLLRLSKKTLSNVQLIRNYTNLTRPNSSPTNATNLFSQPQLRLPLPHRWTMR